MKRLFTCFLTLAFCLCALASCSSAYQENVWFSEEKLEECLVAGLPAVNKDLVNHNDADIYASLTSKERESYVADVLEYLKSRNFKYLGTRGEQKNTLAGVFTTYYFEPATELESFRVIEGDYVFVFSDGAVDKNGDVEFNILVIYSTDKATLEYGSKKFTYNTMISLSQGSEAPLGGFYVLKEEHEHSGEWLASESTHYYQYTCGCPSPDIAELHSDGDGDGLCDVCYYQMLAEGNHFIRNHAGAEWLCEITTEDIAEIKMISGGGGPLPPISLTRISSSTDKSVISSIFEEYYWLDSTPVSEEKTEIADGGYVIVQFILNNGEVKRLYLINGDYYHDGNGNYFEIARLPVFRDGTNFESYYGFEKWTQTCRIHTSDGALACEIPVSELEFTKLPEDTGIGAVVMYTVETDFGTLIFASSKVFYIEGIDTACYELVGKNIDELIAEYSAE